MCLSEYWGSTHKVHEEWLTSHARPQCASGMWRMFSGQCDGTKHLWWIVCHERKLRATKNVAHLKVVVGQGEVDLRMCETFAMISKCIEMRLETLLASSTSKRNLKKDGHPDSAAGPICIHSSNHIRDKWYIDHLTGIQMGLSTESSTTFWHEMWMLLIFLFGTIFLHIFCWHNNSVSKDPKFSTRSKLGSPVRQLSIFNALGSRKSTPVWKKQTRLMSLSIQLASWRFLQKWHG